MEAVVGCGPPSWLAAGASLGLASSWLRGPWGRCPESGGAIAPAAVSPDAVERLLSTSGSECPSWGPVLLPWGPAWPTPTPGGSPLTASAPHLNTLGRMRVSALHVSCLQEGCPPPPHPTPGDSLWVSQHVEWKVAEEELEGQPMTSGSCCGRGRAAGAGAWVTPCLGPASTVEQDPPGLVCSLHVYCCCVQVRTRTTSSSVPGRWYPCEEWLLGLCAVV